MSKQIEAMKLALEALITASGHVNNEAFVKVMMARDALVEALAEQSAQQEPVAWMKPHPKCDSACLFQCTHGFTQFPECATQQPPAQREWVGLTFGEICECESEYANVFARNIEAKLKEKNT